MANTEFGLAHAAKGYLRRRAGLTVARKRFSPARFGPGCDVRRVSSFLVARGADVQFGTECVIDDGFVLECRGRLEVGDRTVFGHHCTIGVAEEVIIGEDCLIAELVSIRDHEHEFGDVDRPVVVQGRRVGAVVIGDNVWLGAKVTVTSGVTIGRDTIVGANSVVTKDLPAGCVAAGVPAKVIRER